MSSRNAYLKRAEREDARALPEVLHMAVSMVLDGHEWGHVWAVAEDELLCGGFQKVDYIELRDADTLEKLCEDNGNARIFIAARIGTTRLIDNMPVKRSQA
jgi:pantoate--beta-alanine ligase